MYRRYFFLQYSLNSNLSIVFLIKGGGGASGNTAHIKETKITNPLLTSLSSIRADSDSWLVIRKKEKEEEDVLIRERVNSMNEWARWTQGIRHYLILPQVIPAFAMAAQQKPMEWINSLMTVFEKQVWDFFFHYPSMKAIQKIPGENATTGTALVLMCHLLSLDFSVI